MPALSSINSESEATNCTWLTLLIVIFKIDTTATQISREEMLTWLSQMNITVTPTLELWQQLKLSTRDTFIFSAVLQPFL